MAERYLLFAGDRYYPAGGWQDFKMDFDSVDPAVIAGGDYDWWHVVDRATGEVVAEKTTGEQKDFL